MGDFLRWRWRRFQKEIPPAEAYDFSLASGEAPGVDTLTWVGQSTLLLRFGELALLTDPHFSDHASPLSWAGPKRVVPPGLSLGALPAIDLVLVSHNHYDHLDTETVRRLVERAGGEETWFIAPKGLKKWFSGKGVERVTELDWWEERRLGDATVTAVPVQHWSKRSLFNGFETLWAGYIVEAGEITFFFDGDSGYSPHFKEIRQHLGPIDLAALPIGAYAPRWFMKPYHMTPEEAVQAQADLGGPVSVALHWGTFILADEPLDEPPRRLRAELDRRGLPEDRFRVLQHGETLAFETLLSKSRSSK